ncbi:hypothetical protein BCS96_11450 [Vibrio breoganii]|nr:hypothetical protein BCU93_07380 [Vibrio breoganii]PMG90236.1 hypothetical protein BCU81_06860 [Vibrio breoganii]PML84849.1 hypothetical protein BCT68_00550 [Vibrio breoganii]PMM44963.1 hypothetical protein BCT52_09970 [Vibrio breoganii]PMO92320.1 hypothetical protein BCS98_10065 [Vibrio breoganii]
MTPIFTWITHTTVRVFSEFSQSYTDGIYSRATRVHHDLSDVYFMMLLLMIILTALLLSRGRPWLIAPRLFLTILATVALLSIFPNITKIVAAKKIRDATLTQLDIIKPYTDNTDKLYSQFLLVHTEDNYMKVWDDIILIAQREKVVLPDFALLNKDMYGTR